MCRMLSLAVFRPFCRLSRAVSVLRRNTSAPARAAYSPTWAASSVTVRAARAASFAMFRSLLSLRVAIDSSSVTANGSASGTIGPDWPLAVRGVKRVLPDALRVRWPHRSNRKRAVTASQNQKRAHIPSWFGEFDALVGRDWPVGLRRQLGFGSLLSESRRDNQSAGTGEHLTTVHPRLRKISLRPVAPGQAKL